MEHDTGITDVLISCVLVVLLFLNSAALLWFCIEWVLSL